ncbi:MAG: hypothetical protein ACM3ZF_16925 [Mycobacterium leprae]
MITFTTSPTSSEESVSFASTLLASSASATASAATTAASLAFFEISLMDVDISSDAAATVWVCAETSTAALATKPA